ncbi:type IV secretion system DNA-binding domain-containing protein [Ruegeria sp. HKCCD8929]|uniref:type IV secretion system DNA-binding domain-containing protein n=1 Tax=Ruegeria sp. HKCCD8929 TaxID=2683006 RepID=UPI001487B669|nr:type IV secretion system DNA-binding domain-containing protein [Ruegeria sp. HKCCD8929]
MATQVLRYSISMAALAFCLCFFWLIWQNYELDMLRVSAIYWLAEFNIETRGTEHRVLEYVDLFGNRVRRTALAIYTDPQLIAIYEHYAVTARRIIWISAIPAAIAFAAVFLIFVAVGRSLKDEEHIRGARLVSAKELKAWSKRKWKAYEKKFGKGSKTGPRYTLAGIEFPPNAVEAQIGITGTVGTGKTNAIHELLNTIREENGRAIVYDRMGGLLRDHYDPDTDIILNPFDARSVGWSPFHEAHTSAAFAQIAEVMVPDQPGSNDPFWTKAARLVFQYAARELAKQKQGKATNADLRRAIMSIPAEELAEIIETTPGAHFFGEHVAKTSGGIRANLITELAFLEYLRDDAPPFSIRDWVIEDRPGFVFLTADAEHAAVTRNIISTVLEVAANALMTTEESRDPKVWFFLDEVPTLNRMPFLPKSLAEIRQFGGAFVLGYQVFSQLEEIYGDKAAETISGVLNNRVVLNTPDFDTAQRSSRSLGEEDVVEMNENLTLGAHEARDGVGIVGRRTQRPIVTPAEIQALPQFVGYFRPAYDAPTAKVRFEPVPTQTRAEKLIPYRGPGFDEGGMQVAATNADIEEGGAPLLGFAAKPPEEQRAEFLRWLLRARPEGAARIEEPALISERDWYWQHFATARVRGVPAANILPPDPAAGFALNGDAARPETATLPYPGEKKREAVAGLRTTTSPPGSGEETRPTDAPSAGEARSLLRAPDDRSDISPVSPPLRGNPPERPHSQNPADHRVTKSPAQGTGPGSRTRPAEEKTEMAAGSTATISSRGGPGAPSLNLADAPEKGLETGPSATDTADTPANGAKLGKDSGADVVHGNVSELQQATDRIGDQTQQASSRPETVEPHSPNSGSQVSHAPLSMRAHPGFRTVLRERGGPGEAAVPSTSSNLARPDPGALGRVSGEACRIALPVSGGDTPSGEPASVPCQPERFETRGKGEEAAHSARPDLFDWEVEGAAPGGATPSPAPQAGGNRSTEGRHGVGTSVGAVDSASLPDAQTIPDAPPRDSAPAWDSDNSHPVNGSLSAPERPKNGRLRRLGVTRPRGEAQE